MARVGIRRKGRRKFVEYSSKERKHLRLLFKSITEWPDHDEAEVDRIVKRDVQRQFRVKGDRLNKGEGYWLKRRWAKGHKRYVERKQREGYGSEIMKRTGTLKNKLDKAKGRFLKSGVVNVTLPRVAKKSFDYLKHWKERGLGFYQTDEVSRKIFGRGGYLMTLLKKRDRRLLG